MSEEQPTPEQQPDTVPDTIQTQERVAEPTTIQAAKPKKRIPLWTIIAASIIVPIIAVAALIAYVAVYLPNARLVGEQHKMESYLKDKYGQEFVVENYRVEGAGFAVEGDPTADAYPKDDKDLKFEVWDRGKFKENNHAYSDEYPGAVWQREEYQDIKSFLTEVFGYTPSYDIKIGTAHYLDGKINGKFGNLSEAIKKYGSGIVYNLSIYDTNVTINELDKISASKKFYIIAKSIIDRGVTGYIGYGVPIEGDRYYGISTSTSSFISINNDQEFATMFSEWRNVKR